MYYPDAKEYITFVFSLLDAFAERKQTPISRGRPKTYSDAALIVFYAMMTLKQINTIRGQHRMPKGLRNVDKTANWSKSAYHGWVYGYGLHLTTTRHGFPVMFEVFPANVNERKVLAYKTPAHLCVALLTC